MRKRFHIERQVQRLADSKTLEIIEGVLQKLVTPKITKITTLNREEFYRKQASEYEKTAYYKSSTSSWSCDCTYCKILILYTYLTMEYSKCERNGSRSRADDLYYDSTNLRRVRKEMESIPMDTVLKDHIKNAKEFIGKNISNLKFRAVKLRPHMLELISKADYLVRVNNIAPRKKIAWF